MKYLMILVLIILALPTIAQDTVINLASTLPAITPVAQVDEQQSNILEKAFEMLQLVDAKAQLTYGTKTENTRLALTGTLPIINLRKDGKVALTAAGMLILDDGMKWGGGPGIRIKDLFNVFDVNASWILQEKQFVVSVGVFHL